MNAREVAKFLDLHPNTVYKMIRRGEIEAIKEGKSYEIPQSEVDRLLSESETVDRSVEKRMALKELLLDIDLKINEHLENINNINRDINTNKDIREDFTSYMIKEAKEITRLENLKEQIKKGDFNV